MKTPWSLHPGVLLASGSWVPERDAYADRGYEIADVAQWYEVRVAHTQWRREDAAEFGPCGFPPWRVKAQREADAAAAS